MWHGSPEDPSIQLAMPPGFSFLQVLRPHDPYHGGLIVFFKKMFKARKIEVPVFQTFETIIVEFSFERRKVFVFGIYRPDSKLVTFLFFGELTSVLEHLFALGDGLIVAGDFNIHIEKPGDTHSINLLKIFDSFQLTNEVNEPTHNLGGTLDLVASTPDIPLSNCRVDPSDVYSDHGLINVSFSVSVKLPLTTRRVERFGDSSVYVEGVRVYVVRIFRLTYRDHVTNIELRRTQQPSVSSLLLRCHLNFFDHIALASLWRIITGSIITDHHRTGLDRVTVQDNHGSANQLRSLLSL
ncbi:hypothetical protein HELRODRAFT_166960 [Helobdella robusta]|uniref:Endonuclease/exonuclease/phosphatase domain-containing protein n=1 Tax=Helobdella robusta TaxID=6412 RepID=T1EYT2_HELRO|nr:hypothetical protein HELRODRAFT_166960 [Helobdella robusta]ESO11876.1 hypothetical protein HELRODRAFT_166960 [Helobdella robusta]